jgi:hypothetical protein
MCACERLVLLLEGCLETGWVPACGIRNESRTGTGVLFPMGDPRPVRRSRSATRSTSEASTSSHAKSPAPPPLVPSAILSQPRPQARPQRRLPRARSTDGRARGRVPDDRSVVWFEPVCGRRAQVRVRPVLSRSHGALRDALLPSRSIGFRGVTTTAPVALWDLGGVEGVCEGFQTFAKRWVRGSLLGCVADS